MRYNTHIGLGDWRAGSAWRRPAISRPPQPPAASPHYERSFPVAEPIRIKRYPNRRFYAGHTKSYVSLGDIEALIRSGQDVEIVDSQTGEDLTRQLLVQIIAERHPEKMALFPTAMLHSMLRANDVVANFLKDYFRNSLSYLDYLHQHGATGPLAQPVHWMKAWFDSWSKLAASGERGGDGQPVQPADASAADPLAARMAELETRIADLEKQTGQGD
ncbi:MAG: polyhydroxyalkanoate synthesis regulator DNA-binding domain-containing protein [Pirellulales bacterium]|nr:polyhydroxyalkanoate synthesis regulator DNA-binding domain-containing protein [Pirellulales bacterium]